jgi:Family of unknown function (DUF5764)
MSTDFVKQSLRENLSRVLIPHVADGLWSIYDNAKTACMRNKQPSETLKTFQNLLTRVPQWSDEVLETEVKRIEKVSKCEYMDDLLLGVFVSYIRAFASLQQSDEAHVNVEFDRPSLSKFIFTLYKSAARKCWSNAYMFKTIDVSSEQQSRNRRDIESMLGGALDEVIDSFIPWKDISKAYFHAKSGAISEKRPDTPRPPVVEEAPAPKPTLSFGQSETVEFETDTEEEERPRLQMGEDIKLDLSDDEEEPAAKPSGTMELNL